MAPLKKPTGKTQDKGNKKRQGHPLEVSLELTERDVANMLIAISYGTRMSFNGDRAHTSSGKAVRITVIPSKNAV